MSLPFCLFVQTLTSSSTRFSIVFTFLSMPCTPGYLDSTGNPSILLCKLRAGSPASFRSVCDGATCTRSSSQSTQHQKAKRAVSLLFMQGSSCSMYKLSHLVRTILGSGSRPPGTFALQICKVQFNLTQFLELKNLGCVAKLQLWCYFQNNICR